ncbi:hypothetical protein BKH46_08240 [Helicobacter sp. 12S02634-8]|uniref:hypothetical protein n=1 Tax=Helicobacter sp. 12S02634-8 TaxID=1476199 RepID=UPI000BA747C2|nr:hypothetical protein [Helicobacter sp. 12S02634-8]PAF46221.1 hypothetical protein BKH46_08240 [Helicobacter sp. 12S02634-8]
MKKLALIALAILTFGIGANAQESTEGAVEQKTESANNLQAPNKTEGAAVQNTQNKPQAPNTQKTIPLQPGFSAYINMDVVEYKIMDFKGLPLGTLDLILSLGPTYNITKNFGVGVRTGIGLEILLLRPMSGASFNYTFPLAADAFYMFNKNFAVALGTEFDIGGYFKTWEISAKIIYKSNYLKAGIIPYASYTPKIGRSATSDGTSIVFSWGAFAPK